MWLSNTDEDDKEEEWPEKLDDQLDLWTKNVGAIKNWLNILPKMGLIWQWFNESDFNS